MLDSLNKYTESGHFFFEPSQRLQDVCNAPTDKSGVYIIYELRKGKVDLIYVGCSGRLKADGKMFVRKAGGLKDRIVNGHQFGKTPRRLAWPIQMTTANIDALDIYWYVTHCDSYQDCPRRVERELLQKYFDTYARLPKWNKAL